MNAHHANHQLELLPAFTPDDEVVPPEPFQIMGKMWRTSEVFDTYWRFAFKRQELFFSRVTGGKSTIADPILASYRFTNPYRAADRVSQYLIRHVIYGGSQRPEQLFFRIMLFKLFNKIETWSLLEEQLGDLEWSAKILPKISRVLSQALSSGKRIYSAAYIMPSGGSAYARKHDAHLFLLGKMMDETLYSKIADASSMEEAFGLLRAQPMLGDFLAYQFITDLNYSTLCDFDEKEFVIAGPGAKDGLRKCFPDLPSVLTSAAIRAVCAQQEVEFKKRGLHFQTLWGRPLQLIDCQNVFCETDKYARVAHPHIVGTSGRSRIKQQYRPAGPLQQPFFPTKWGLDPIGSR